jgi:dTMP kinase
MAGNHERTVESEKSKNIIYTTKMKSKLICLAGLDGSGKTTQANLLKNWISGMGYDCQLIKFHTEPNRAEYNELCQKAGVYLMNNRLTVSFSEIELIKEAFSLQKKLEESISPALRSGKNVILDRYYETYDAYVQLKNEKIHWIDKIIGSFPVPDLYIFIDTQPHVCYERLKKQRLVIHPHEQLEALIKTRDYYLSHKDRYLFVIIDGKGSVAHIFMSLQQIIKSRFGIEDRR